PFPTRRSSDLDGALRAHHAETFDRAGVFASRAHPGRVDEEKALARAFVKNVDGIARRSRQLAHDRPSVAHDRVDERRFSGVRFPDNGERERGIFDFRFSIFDWGLGKKAIDGFKEFRYPAAVGRTDGDGVVEAESREIRLE